jgi:Zn finger protein HypA/HybF involved in hydrogenase expression
MVDNAIVTCVNCQHTMLLDMPILNTLCPKCHGGLFIVEQWVNCTCQDCGLMWGDSFRNLPEFECPRCASKDCISTLVHIEEDDLW